MEAFAARYRPYSRFVQNEGRFLFDLLISPDSFNRAQVATVDLDLPAVAGVAKISYEAVQAQAVVEWSDYVKQYIGALICTLLEANGFQKTGVKRAIPHHGFTKGEMYRLGDDAAAVGS
jgi:hypothetical protein